MSSKTMNREREHEFTLVLSGISKLTTATEDALFEAGCDDATISLRAGRMYLTFSRTAPTLKEAILTALRDVRKAKIGADVLRVDDSNLVTQAEIARKIGRSRQLVFQYVTGARGPGNFPPPVCDITDDAPLWSWCEVAGWLHDNGMLKAEDLRDAEELDAINIVLEFKQMQKKEARLLSEVMCSIFPKKMSDSLRAALD